MAWLDEFKQETKKKNKKVVLTHIATIKNFSEPNCSPDTLQISL